MTTKKIYEDDKRVVYMRDERPNETWLYYHMKEDGVEMIPRGYMLGDNALKYELLAPKAEQA